MDANGVPTSVALLVESVIEMFGMQAGTARLAQVVGEMPRRLHAVSSPPGVKRRSSRSLSGAGS